MLDDGEADKMTQRWEWERPLKVKRISDLRRSMAVSLMRSEKTR